MSLAGLKCTDSTQLACMAQQGPTLDTVLGEAFVKAAQVVLSSRVFQASKQPEQAPPKKKAWFNLELEELESANKTLEPWRRDVGRPLVLEVFLQPWGTAEPQSSQPGQAPVETLLEQWVFHYQPVLPQGPALSRSQLSRLNPTSIYKRLIIMLRSLFCYVRVLPAYRLFRVCKRQRGSNFTIGFRVSGTLPRRAGSDSSSATQTPAAAGSSAGSSSRPRGSGRRSLQHFEFAPVETPYGQFKVSVAYQPASRVTILEQTTSPPPLPQIISDYVGGGRAPGQLPLRHTMSASLCSEQQGVQGQGALRSSTAGAALTAHSGSHGAPASPSGQMQRQASAFTPLPRHSWSSSAMRISPNRLCSPHHPQQHPAGAQLSPFANREGPGGTPYGSAPQLGPLHSPNLLRALSMQPQQPGMGSPSRSKPPRPPQRGQDAGSQARPIPAGRARSSPLPCQAERGEGEEEDGEGAEDEGSEEGGDDAQSAGSSARQSSAPMSIPRRSSVEGRTRRLRSSGDLWGMHQPADVPKPLSAPAVSHLAARGAQPSSQETGGTGSHTTDASLPPGPLPLIPGSSALESESSGSAASSSLFPTSCSPQLPFAFTPSAQSLASYGSAKGPLVMMPQDLERISPRLRRTSSGAGASGPGLPLSPSPASAGMGPSPGSWRTTNSAAYSSQRQGSAPAAGAGAQRRQSSQQQQQQLLVLGQGQGQGSGAGPGGPSPPQQHVQFAEDAAGGSGAVTGRAVPTSSALLRRASWSGRSSAHLRKSSVDAVGYSVSPMQDPLLESVMGGSTPRQYSFGLPTPLGMAGALRGISRTNSSVSAGTPPPLLTYPSMPTEGGRSGGLEEQESDVLPFALDGDAHPGTPAGGASPGSQGPCLTGPPHQPPQAAAGSPNTARAMPAPGAPTAPGLPLPSSSPAVAVAPSGAAASDAAVGAFVRLLQEAPPLQSFAGSGGGGVPKGDAPLQSGTEGVASMAGGSVGGRLTLQAGLQQFELLRQRLESRGMVVTAVDA